MKTIANSLQRVLYGHLVVGCVPAETHQVLRPLSEVFQSKFVVWQKHSHWETV